MIYLPFGTALHIAAVLAADFKQCGGDLAEGADADCVHQFFEHVGVVDGGLL